MKIFLRYFKKAVFSLLYVVFLLLLIEIGSRTFWNIKNGVPFFRPKEIIYKFYPELKEVRQKPIKKEDGYFDILLLGGSALHKKWGNIEEILLQELINKTETKVRIHNVSKGSHTSLDSYIKYRYLLDKEFDIVLFYHGINEVTANICPYPLFKEDYSHYAWYDEIYLFERHKEVNFAVFPYTLRYILIKIIKKSNLSKYVPMHPPKKEWMDYGSDVKTEASFRKNLTKILDIASAKKEPVLLMTVSFYIPEDYSLTKFKEKGLDYGTHHNAIEIWGKPENVAKGITVHNKVISDIATHYKNVIFIDQDGLIPKDGSYFNDICHFTDKGCRKFVDNILDIIVEAI